MQNLWVVRHLNINIYIYLSILVHTSRPGQQLRPQPLPVIGCPVNARNISMQNQMEAINSRPIYILSDQIFKLTSSSRCSPPADIHGEGAK